MVVKIQSVQDIKNEFLARCGGQHVLEMYPKVQAQNFEDPYVVEGLEAVIGSDVHQNFGFVFEQFMDITSTLISNSYKTYKSESQISEDFSGTIQAMSPTPQLSQGLVLYQYTNSVIPYLAHMFDMKGSNRAFAYFMKLVAKNSVGDVTANDLLASPKTISKQATSFLGTKYGPTEVDVTVAGQVDYVINLPYAPVAPQTLVITIDGVTGSFQDLTTGTVDGMAYLTPVGGDLGSCHADLNTGEVTIALSTAPLANGVSIKATFNRDAQTEAAATTNIAEVSLELENVPLVAEDFSVKTNINIQQEALYRAIFGGDWNQTADDMLGAIYNKEIGNRILKDLNAAIPAASAFTRDLTAQSQEALFSLKAATYSISNIDVKIANASGNQISAATTYAISQDVKPVLEGLDKFTAYESFDESQMGGPALVGTYRNRPVVASPTTTVLPSGTVLGLHKSKKQAFLAPAVFGNFMLPVIRNIYNYDNSAAQNKQLISMAAEKIVAENLVAKATFTGIGDLIGS